MLNRLVIDLSVARKDEEEVYNVSYWKYLYIGDCDGDVSMRFNTKRGDDLNPEEFDKITGLDGINYLLISNTAQPGKKLVLYYEEKKGGWYI